MLKTLAGEGCLLSETTLDPPLNSTLVLVTSALYCTEGPFDNLQTLLKPLYHHQSPLLNLRRRRAISVPYSSAIKCAVQPSHSVCSLRIPCCVQCSAFMFSSVPSFNLYLCAVLKMSNLKLSYCSAIHLLCLVIQCTVQCCDTMCSTVLPHNVCCKLPGII